MNMNKIFSATGLASLAWLSAFAMIWLIILQIIAVGISNVSFLIFFFIIALSASAMVGNRR